MYIDEEHARLNIRLAREKRESQPEVIRDVLKKSRGGWVCGSYFYAEYMPTYSQRIGELIVQGYEIEREPCKNPDHKHRGSIRQYRIKRVR